MCRHTSILIENPLSYDVLILSSCFGFYVYFYFFQFRRCRPHYFFVFPLRYSIIVVSPMFRLLPPPPPAQFLVSSSLFCNIFDSGTEYLINLTQTPPVTVTVTCL